MNNAIIVPTMFLIQGILVSREIFTQKFVCNLSVCKGACCWEGDWGAPLDEQELVVLASIREQIRPYLSDEGNQAIDDNGTFVYYEEPQKTGTTLVADGRCAYMTTDMHGIAQCGFEQAHRDGVIAFKKPVSCHLYPLRHEVEDERSFEALNYDEWDICSAACNLGESLRVPVFKFVKEAIVRKFGEAFYAELDAVAGDLERLD